MTNNNTNISAQRISHILSDIFSPLLVPSYATAIALWFTMLRYLPLGVKLWALGGVFIITAIAPALVIIALYRTGKVSDMSISDKSQRTIPYCTSMLCYLGAGYFMHSMQAPSWLVAFFLWRGSRVGLITYNHSFVENQRTCRSRRRYGSRMLLACTTRTSRSANAMGVDNDSHSWSGIMGKTIPQSPHSPYRCLPVPQCHLSSYF